MGTVAIDAPDQFLGSGSKPADSPGKCSAVLCPYPYARRYLSMRVLPRRWAIRSVPTFDELATMSVIVHDPVAWFSSSWMLAVPMVMWSGTVMLSVGCTTPSSRAPEIVTPLFAEPGSYTLVTALFDALGTGGPPLAPGCRLAMARISPVRGLL